MELKINRLGLLIKRHLLASGSKFLAGISIGVLVSMAISIFGLIAGGSIQLHGFRELAFGIYLIGGIIMTSMAFSEINKPETGYQLMILPASSLEKFTSSWVFTSIIYSVMAFIMIILATCILYVFQQFGYTVQGELFDFHKMGEAFRQYVVGNIVFLAGAAAFRKNAFFKTVLSTIASFAFFGLFSLLLMKSFGYFELAESMNGVSNVSINSSALSHMFSNPEILGVAVNLYIAVLLLLVGFFKFKEREL